MSDIPERADGEGLSQLDDDCSWSQLVAGVARVPVIVACVSIEQGISAATHALDDTGARRNSRHVFSGYCRHQKWLTDALSQIRNAPSDLPRSPLSRVNGRWVNMHSNATRWKTLLTVLCVPTMRTYLRRRPSNVKIKSSYHWLLNVRVNVNKTHYYSINTDFLNKKQNYNKTTAFITLQPVGQHDW